MIARSLDELTVYRKSIAACAEVSAILDRPQLRRDGDVRVQLSSSTAAIPANIAEGFGQQSDRQFVKYLFIARGSCNEVKAHLEVAYGRRYITSAELEGFLTKYDEVARMLTGLIKYLRASDRKQRG